MAEYPKYDAWLHWVVTNNCQYHCKYCLGGSAQSKTVNPINVPALIKALDKTGLIYKIGLTGGEPMLVSNIVEACVAITQKHYVILNTNFTLPNAKRFIEEVDPTRVHYLGVSLHIEEVERMKLLDTLIDNSLRAVERKYPILVSQVAHPTLYPRVEELRAMFTERNIPFEYTLFVGHYEGKTYPDAYSPNELSMLGLNPADDDSKTRTHHLGEPCNAAYNAAVILPNEWIIPCMDIHEPSVGNIYGEIKFQKKLMTCSTQKCSCPLKKFDGYLYRKALKENGME